MAIPKSLVAVLAAFGVAQGSLCKPPSLTTTSQPPACTPGLISPQPAGLKCGLVGTITSGNTYLGYGSSYATSLDRCFLGCSLNPPCQVIHYTPGDNGCDYYSGPVDFTTDGVPPVFPPAVPHVYDLSCYNFCS